MKAIEHPLALVHGNPGTAVGHGDERRPLGNSDIDVHRAALRGVAHRVVDQVREQCMQPRGIAFDAGRLGASKPEVDVLLCRELGELRPPFL